MLSPEQKTAAIELAKTVTTELSCYTLAREYNAKFPPATRFGPRVDWHEFAYLLDELYTAGILKVTGHGRDGQTVYQFAA